MSTAIKTEKANYDFIDSLRFIAIITIVIEHSYFWPQGQYFSTPGEQWIQTITMQLFKFGTVIFFILAGFLIGDKIKTTSSLTYLKRRFNGTFKPWLFWVSVFLLLIVSDVMVRYIKGANNLELFTNPISFLGNRLSYIVFDTSFWFILNFLAAISILFIFKKHLYSYKLGIFLAACSLFYSINIYTGWIVSRHTTAIFGFIFYLWLGVQMHRYFNEFNQWIKKQSILLMGILVLITFLLACFESLLLMNSALKTDPYNTLRITNIIFSLATFLFLYRLGNLNFVKSLNPRSTTYGIYLIHYIIIEQLLPQIFGPLHISNEGKTSFELIIIQYGRFIFVYLSTYLIVHLINKSPRIKWIIGQ